MEHIILTVKSRAILEFDASLCYLCNCKTEWSIHVTFGCHVELPLM